MGNQTILNSSKYRVLSLKFEEIHLDDDRRTKYTSTVAEFIANSIVSVVKLWRIATLYINVGNTKNRTLINQLIN